MRMSKPHELLSDPPLLVNQAFATLRVPQLGLHYSVQRDGLRRAAAATDGCAAA